VLNNTLGDNPPLASNVSGLGPSGTLSAPYVSPTTLGSLASTMLAAQAQDSASITNQLTTEQSVQAMLSSKLSTQSGVDIDTEVANMIELQNAYGANARVLSAVQSMWTQLLNSVTS
jgi:flagellar hook-associated protein 1 FlgK